MSTVTSTEVNENIVQNNECQEATPAQDEDAPQVENDEKLKQEEVVVEAEDEAVKAVSVGTSTVLIETQEVVSSSTSVNRDTKQPSGKAKSAPRRASYQSSRNYPGNFQNYGLTYLPYKSNFEPSDDARRRAEEFLKQLRL